MCDHTTRAIGLEHGAAHTDDHLAWTRRDFLVRSGLAAAGAAVLTGAGPARAATLGAARHPGLLGALRALDTDRVLVLVQLSGGNDGLNTVVPIHDDRYYNARSGLALPASATLRLDDDLGFHPAFAPLMNEWGDGRLAVVEGVGYQDQSLSHFEGIDVWASAREDDGDRGWTALAAESIGGDPATPPSVQVGASYPLLMTGSDGVEGMTLSSPDLLDQIVTSGELFDTSALPDTPVGRQLRFVREVANDANLYVGSMRAAADGVTNAAEYATDGFSKSLAQVARLIKGRLGTRVYLVRLGGFDTHANQLDAHHGLLDRLAAALAAFYQDLGATGDDERVLTMTFSEFGRRVAQNGSAGTDHGTAAPLFLLGPGVTGGRFGGTPDLGALDGAGNLPVTTDFRSVYASVLGGWLGLDAAVTSAILGGSYAPLDLFSRATASGPAPGLALDLSVFPNPVSNRARVRFSVAAEGPAEVALFDTRGRRVARLASGSHAAGAHEADLDASGLAGGVYLARLTTPAGAVTRSVTVAR